MLDRKKKTKKTLLELRVRKVYEVVPQGADPPDPVHQLRPGAPEAAPNLRHGERGRNILR